VKELDHDVVGIASREQVKEVLETGAPTIRIVKPFQELDAMVKELKVAEQGGPLLWGPTSTSSTEAKRGTGPLLQRPWREDLSEMRTW